MFPKKISFLMIFSLVTLLFPGLILAEYSGLSGFSELAFIKRNAFDPNHYYTEFINSSWKPGGGIFILNLEDRSERELFPQMSGGVFGRFDISFDAKAVPIVKACAAEKLFSVNLFTILSIKTIYPLPTWISLQHDLLLVQFCMHQEEPLLVLLL